MFKTTSRTRKEDSASSIVATFGSSRGSSGSLNQLHNNAIHKSSSTLPTMASEGSTSSTLTFSNKSTSLSALLEHDRKLTNNPGLAVPLIVSESIEFLFHRGLMVEGIFRVPGDVKRLQVLEDAFNQDKGHLCKFDPNAVALLSQPQGSVKGGASIDATLLSVLNQVTCEDVSSLLKKFLRDSLKDPLFPIPFDEKFQGIKQLNSIEETITAFKAIFAHLPEENKRLTYEWLFLLVQIAANSDQNKMDPVNLATVFGEMAGVPYNRSQWLVQFMIENFDALFIEDKINSEQPSVVTIRKLEGHSHKSISSVVPVINNSFVLAADSGGSVSVWDSKSYAYVNCVSSEKRYYQAPLEVNFPDKNLYQLWIIFPDTIRCWNIQDIVGGGKIPDTAGNVIPLGHACTPTIIGDVAWICTQKQIHIVDVVSHQVKKTIDSHAIIAGAAGKYVCSVNDKTKSVDFWNPETYAKEKELKIDELRQPTSVVAIGNNVWVTTLRGPVVVIDIESLTYKVLEEQRDIYHVMQVGSLVWICGLERNILVFDPKSLTLVKRLPIKHRDIITRMAPIRSDSPPGYHVWTSSNDGSIQVTFIPDKFFSLGDSFRTAADEASKLVKEKQDLLRKLEADLVKQDQEVARAVLKLHEDGKEQGLSEDAMIAQVDSYLKQQQQEESKVLEQIITVKRQLHSLKYEFKAKEARSLIMNS